MEKIYMEKNNNHRNNSFFQKVKNSTLSVKLCFVLAIVTVLSLGSVAFNNVSYAMPDDVNLDTGFVAVSDSTAANASISGNHSMNATPAFNVIRYYVTGHVNDGKYEIYCLERNINFEDNTTYTKGSEITDSGLIYLIANTYPNVSLKDSDGTDLDPVIQGWISQTAIWLYQRQIDGANYTGGITDDQVTAIMQDTSLSYNGNTYHTKDSVNLYTTYIKPLIDAAVGHNVQYSLSVAAESNQISTTTDNEYQTALFGVTANPSDDFTGYTVSIQGPTGTYIVTDSGAKVTPGDGTILAPATKFYIRTPKKNVKEANAKVTVTVNGTFKTYTGYYMIGKHASDNNPAQKVALVTTGSKQVSTGTEYALVPDTGSNASLSIYFIGLIILLCGVGIIYANVKPSKQQ